MTWALIIITALMAVTAIATGLAVAATEDVSEAEIENCVQGGGFFGPPRTRGECVDQLGSADDVVTLIFILWLIGFLVLSLIWFKTRPPSPSLPHPSSGSVRRRH
jgi:hypothetical protein